MNDKVNEHTGFTPVVILTSSKEEGDRLQGYRLKAMDMKLHG